MYAPLVNFFADGFDSAPGAATTAVTGTDNAATALIAAVDSNVRNCFLIMDSSGRALRIA